MSTTLASGHTSSPCLHRHPFQLAVTPHRCSSPRPLCSPCLLVCSRPCPAASALQRHSSGRRPYPPHYFISGSFIFFFQRSLYCPVLLRVCLSLSVLSHYLLCCALFYVCAFVSISLLLVSCAYTLSSVYYTNPSLKRAFGIPFLNPCDSGFCPPGTAFLLGKPLHTCITYLARHISTQIYIHTFVLFTNFLHLSPSRHSLLCKPSHAHTSFTHSPIQDHPRSIHTRSIIHSQGITHTPSGPDIISSIAM